jgi:acyl-CoA reductase-like NAD-dependent aldehyde dehydrogenase
MQNQLYIDGRFVDAVAGGTIDVVSPHDGSLITRIAAAEAACCSSSRTRSKHAAKNWRSSNP